MPEISIIIPVYNTSDYLHECLESVIAQTFQDIEIICINDGSTDNSLEILNEFHKKDPRIIIIDHKNQGVSATRNAGLGIATGKYIGFVDSDDTISSTYYEILLKEIKYNNCDAVYSRFFKRNSFREEFNRENILNRLLPEFFRLDSYNSVCNKLYRGENIKTNNLRFPVGITHGEDAHFNIEFLLKANKIIIVDHAGYNYRKVLGSATQNISVHPYLEHAVEVYKTDWSELIEDIISADMLNELKKERFVNKIISLIYIYGNRGNKLSDNQRISNLKKIVTHPEVIKAFSSTQMIDQLQLGSYKRSIFNNIRRQNVLTLYLLTQYSYYRNL